MGFWEDILQVVAVSLILHSKQQHCYSDGCIDSSIDAYTYTLDVSLSIHKYRAAVLYLLLYKPCRLGLLIQHFLSPYSQELTAHQDSTNLSCIYY